MILSTTTQKLQVALGGAVSANQCPIVVDYVDFTSSNSVPGSQLSNTNGASYVDVLAAPAASTQRKVNSVSLYNADTASVSVTVVLDDNGTDYHLVSSISIDPGDSLTYTDGVWSVGSKFSGGVNSLRKGWIQEFFTDGTWVKPASARFCLVEVVGAGGGGGAGEGRSSNAAIRSGGAGGGGAKRMRAVFLSQNLPNTVAVTVAQRTASAAGGNDAVGAHGTAGGTSSFGTYLYGYGGGGGCGGGQFAAGAGGGGGGGGTSAGSSSANTAAGRGGSAVAAPSVTAHLSDSRGCDGGQSGVSGYGSYLGGGGGGGSSASGSSGSVGGASTFSGGGGGGGGGMAAGFSIAAVGAAGGDAGGSVGTSTAGGGAGGGSVRITGQGGATNPGFCGQGGGGGSSSGSTTGGRGGDGGFPGGGGGGGGAGTPVGGDGGRGGAGVVRVWCW